MAQHYKNEEITLSRLDTFIGWENFNTKGNVASGRMDQNLCGRLYSHHDRGSIGLSVHSPVHNSPLSFEEILSTSEFRPCKLGESFGPTWSVHLFRLDITVPESLDGQIVHLIWNSNTEAMVLSETGHPRQGLVGGDGMCRRVDYQIFPEPARQGDKIRLYVEISCNGLFGAGRGGNIEPPDPDVFYELSECCLAAFHPIAWRLIHDLTLLHGMAIALPKNCPQRASALLTANAIVNSVDVSDYSTYGEGRAIASKILKNAKNGTTQTTIVTQLHSHIDLAWLWPMASTPRKGARTFSTHLRILEKYPKAVYVQSQAQLYSWIMEQYPSLFQEVKQMVHLGRFLPVGGTWVEMDCNIPCGESLIRQFLEGQQFFRKEFGAICREFWLPDTFGYPAQLPQIMKLSGIKFFLTIKLSWNLFNKFPHSTFLWEGLDGSQVIAHFPPADTYNATGSVEEVINSGIWNKDIGVLNSSMMLVGHGDGGGGASPAMLESLTRMQDIDGVPRVMFDAPMKFFDEAELIKKELPRWVGELYFELHRGTFTSQANIKRANRCCEISLIETEMVCTLATIECRRRGLEYKYPRDELKRLWRNVLLNQFHDTLPGSSIGEVYKEADAYHRHVLEALEVLKQESRRLLSPALRSPSGTSQRFEMESDKNVSSLNSGNHGLMVEWFGNYSSSAEKRSFLVTAVKSEVASQFSEGVMKQQLKKPAGEVLVGLKLSEIAIGIIPDPKFLLEAEIGGNVHPAIIEDDCKNCEFLMSNGIVQARVSYSGRLSSLVLLGRGEQREVISLSEEKQRAEGNMLVLFDDVPMFWDAWDVEVYNFEKKKTVPPARKCEILELGPLRVAVGCEYPPTNAGSTIYQTISLSAGSGQIDFETKVMWKESRKLLRVIFNTNVRSSNASYGTQFGYVTRPTTFNTSWECSKFEVCGHQFADLSEYGFGVSLLSDSKYGFSVRDSIMRLSLLRSSKSPDDKADMGTHVFRYSIFPHWQAFPCASVLPLAMGMSHVPLIGLTERGILGARGFLVKLLAAGLQSIVISATKMAETAENALLVRAYESLGGRGTAFFEFGGSFCKRAVLCDLLEREIVCEESSNCARTHLQVLSESKISVYFSAFQIRSFLIFF